MSGDPAACSRKDKRKSDKDKSVIHLFNLKRLIVYHTLSLIVNRPSCLTHYNHVSMARNQRDCLFRQPRGGR